MAETFLFHDYETFGADPARDGVAQFAAIRTDTSLQPVDDPVMFHCKPVVDRLPHPEACLVTGIAPQDALALGIGEYEFAARVHELMIQPGTCALGYNSIRFDDAFTRHLLWRNFHDPYAREWRNGNCRFDLIDLARLCYALRPSGIEWPRREDGRPSFRLEHLASANALKQARAHDALADVEATVELARLIRHAQPRLWDFALTLRDKRRVRGLLDWAGGTPVLHASEKFGADRGCLGLVLPVGPSPESDHGIIVVDLMADPAALIDCDIDELRDRLYTPRADLPEDIERPAIKTVHANRCPMLAPTSVLDGSVDLGRIGLDPARCEQHRRQLLATPGLHAKLVEVVRRSDEGSTSGDVELSLYRGGFPDDAERARIDRVRSSSPGELSATDFGFQQSRHVELLFRLRARNWPDTLNDAERERWHAFVAERLRGTHPLSSFGLEEYRQRIAALRASQAPGAPLALLDRLDDWGNALEREWL